MLSTINSTKWPRDKNKMIVKDFTLMQTDNLILKNLLSKLWSDDKEKGEPLTLSNP